MDSLLISNLSKCFPAQHSKTVSALQNVTLSVNSGECLVLVGPSGCGKTTLLRLIAGLETPDSGSILLNDVLLNPIAPKDRDVAMVFQHHALFPHLTALENIAFGLKLRKLPKAEIHERVASAVETLGLQSVLHRKPAALSGGECQRVALGRALVRRPKIFLLDEPLSQVDAPMRAQLREAIARVHRKTNAVMIYVTHDLTEAAALAHRIAIMRQGKIEKIGTPQEIQQGPLNQFSSLLSRQST